jgi:UDP-glucose 4-epimerase
MHVLVTGAAGLIGSHVMISLLSEGHSVIATDINPLPPVVLAQLEKHTDRVTELTGDLTSLKFVDEIFVHPSAKGLEGIMHIGGIRSPVGMDPRIVHNINVTASYNILQTAASKGITRIVQASSCNALGLSWTMPQHWELDFVPVDETHPMRPVCTTYVSHCHTFRLTQTRKIPTAYLSSYVRSRPQPFVATTQPPG